MLQSIRDRSHGWLSAVILSLVCLAFILWGIQSYLESSSKNEVAAKVNGHVISQADVNAAYERLRQHEQMQLGSDFIIDSKIEAELKKQALNQLIMGQILSDDAVKNGYRVTKEEVDAALLSVPAFQVNGRFSRERFNEVLSSILYNEKSFLNDMQMTMLVNQVRAGFVESAFVLPSEVATAIKLVNQKRDIGYLIIPTAHFKDAITIDDDAAQQYYQQHQSQFVAPEQVSIEYVELSLPQIAAKLHFTEQQLTQFYQDNLNNYTQPIRWHIAHILVKLPPNATPQEVAEAKIKIDNIAKRAHAGEDFKALAQTYSDDLLSAKNGGLLDWFSPGMVDPGLEKIASGLKQIGEISQPTLTKYGYSLVKLIDVKKPEIYPLAKVRTQVEKALVQQQAVKEFADDSDKLSNLTYANPGSLDIAAKALNLEVKHTNFFTRQGGKDTLSSNPKVLATAFKSDILQGNNSDVIELNPETLIVLRVKQHKLASLRPFADVRDEVIQQLKTQLAEQKADALSQKLLQQLKQNHDGEQVAHQTGFKWQVLTNTTRYGSQAAAAIINAAFRLPRPANQSISCASLKLPHGDYVVLAVTAVHDGNADNVNETEQRIYREQLENSYGQLDYSLYVQELVNKAKVKVNKQKS